MQQAFLSLDSEFRTIFSGLQLLHLAEADSQIPLENTPAALATGGKLFQRTFKELLQTRTLRVANNCSGAPSSSIFP